MDIELRRMLVSIAMGLSLGFLYCAVVVLYREIKHGRQNIIKKYKGWKNARQRHLVPCKWLMSKNE